MNKEIDRKVDASLALIKSMFRYISLIKSVNNPEKLYVGYAANFQQCLETHNSGGSIHTKKDRPWELVVFLMIFIFKLID